MRRRCVRWWRRRWLRGDKAEFERSRHGRPGRSYAAEKGRSSSWPWLEHRVPTADPSPGRDHCAPHSEAGSVRPTTHRYAMQAAIVDSPNTRSKAQIPFGSLRLDTTRHVRRAEPMYFGCVQLVVQHGLTRSSRLARHVERVVSRRDEPGGIWA